MASSSFPLLPTHNTQRPPPPRPPPLHPPNQQQQQQRQPPVTITIRFASVALSDLRLSLTNPHSTTVSSLKHLIRTHRPEDTARRRLRLIYGGKVLADQGIVGEIVGLPRFLSSLPPPPRREVPKIVEGEEEEDEEFAELRQSAATAKRGTLNKGKGKVAAVAANEESVVEEAEEVLVPPTIPTRNVYIHCSVGEELDDAGLAEEAVSESQAVHQPSTLPAPQGFDRLLSAGFTEADIAALRSQFHGSLVNTASASASIDPTLGSGITTATIPGDAASGASLSLLDEESRRRALALEERWIDDSANNANGDVGGVGGVDAAGSGIGGGTNAAGGGGGSATVLGGYEDFLVGLMWGFFWPVCVVWIFREEVMSQRKYVAVAVGVMANLFFGVLRVSA